MSSAAESFPFNFHKALYGILKALGQSTPHINLVMHPGYF